MSTSLNSYLIIKLGRMATYLEWTTVSDEIDLIIEDTIELLGLASEGASTDSVKLKSVALFVLWQAVLMTLATDYDFTADKATYKRSQMMDAAQENFNIAKKNATQYLSFSQIFQGEVTETDDPYKNSDLDEFTERALI